MKHPLLEINEDCHLPILASLELSHLGLLKWDADGPMPPITSFVLHDMRQMKRTFRSVLLALPNLQSLVVNSDGNSWSPDGRISHSIPVVLHQLTELRVEDCEDVTLSVLVAPALEDLTYRITSYNGRVDRARPIRRLSMIRKFLRDSHVAACLQALVVCVPASTPIDPTKVKSMLDGLVVLNYLYLDLGSARPYHGLHYYDENRTLNVPTLKRAEFRIFNNNSAIDIIMFAANHTWVGKCDVLWFSDTESRDYIGEDKEREIQNCLENAGWRQVSSGRCKLRRP